MRGRPSSKVSLIHRIKSLFDVQLFAVDGVSMMPNFREGDVLLVSVGAYHYHPPKRGDVVILNDSRDVTRRYVKRVIALPFEEISLSEGLLFVDGKHLSETYLKGLPANLGLGEASWKLNDNEYFVMGDNRAHSTDSRDFGPVTLNLVVGKVRLRLWPVIRLGSSD